MIANGLGKISVDSLLISIVGSLLAALLLYFLKVLTPLLFLMVVLFLSLTSALYQYHKLKESIGIKRIWLPSSRHPIKYRIQDAQNEYIAMGITLHSMLQTTGIGIDIESFAKSMPKNLHIKLLILDPKSPFFEERIKTAHPKSTNIQQTIISKKNQQIELIRQITNCFKENAEIHYYNTFPAWWIQMLDEEIIYLATQTKESHIGQSYPFCMKLVKSRNSELFWTIQNMLKSILKNSQIVTLDNID